MAQTQTAPENQFPTETIGSLMAECEELTRRDALCWKPEAQVTHLTAYRRT